MNTHTLTAEVVADTPCGTGEGPLWHAEDRVLLWTDIPAGMLHRFDPATGRHDTLLEGGRPIGGFTIQADGSLRGRVVGVPTPRVTSCAFAGPGLRDLYITIGGGAHRSDDDPVAGSLFRVRTEAAGRPAFRSRIGL